MKQAQEYIDKVNEKAGYKKIRSVSQFVEEAIITFAAGQLEKAELPDVVLERIVKLAFERDELAGMVLRSLVALPRDEARAKLRKVLSKKELEGLRKLLEV